MKKPCQMSVVCCALLLVPTLRLFAQSEPEHPILTISGSGSGASGILSSWTEAQYTNNFTPRLAPRSEGSFAPEVVSGDTDWSWNTSNPNQLTSLPSGTIFPNGSHTIHTQAVTVMNGNVVDAPYYLRAGSATAKSLVFNLIAHNQRGKLRDDFNALAPAYVNSGTNPATRNDAYARRIAVALLDWARYFPNYTVTAKNNATFINTGPGYILSQDLQRASDHNGLAHEWGDDELFAFDAIHDSVALTNLSTEVGFDVRAYIKSNLFYDEGDFLVYHVPPDVATDSNLSGPYRILPMVARVLNRPDYILWMDDYLDITVREKIRRDGTLSEGMGYSVGYINENINAAKNTRDYFLSRAADTPELQAISNRVGNYVTTLEYGKAQWANLTMPNGVLPSFGDTGFQSITTARGTGRSDLLPSYGTVALGAGSGNQAIQLNQNFSGDNNHMRSDTTAFGLWAFDNEYLGNIRYHNSTPGRNFTEQILAYNAVTIDRSDMASPGANTYGNGDLTLYEPGNNGLAVTEIDGQRAYNNKASRYQRIMMLNTIDLAKPYVVDVFRVAGGTNHDYVLHGSIRYDHTNQCSFPLVTNTQMYPMLEGGEVWVEPTSSGSTFPYYGFWRNVSSNQAPGNFQITYRDISSSKRDTRLWMTDDPAAAGPQVYIGRTPVPARNNAEPGNFWTNNLWRQSAIIRKRVTSGPLQDLFVSVIEPMNAGVSNVVSVERIPMAGSTLESVGLRVTLTGGRVDTYLVNLRNPEVAGANTGSPTVSTTNGNYSLTGRIGMHTTGPQGSRVWAVNASTFQYPGGTYAPSNLYYSGSITGETRRLAGGAHDALVTTTPLPLGTALRGKQLSLTFGTLSGGGITTNISELFQIDQILFTNGQYHVCFTNDHYLEITNSVTVEQVAPLRTFAGTNRFEIALSASLATSAPGAPSGLTAIAGNGQVTLSWVAGLGATSYNVRRSTASGGPYVTIAGPATAAYTDTTVTNGMTHYYVVSAVNEAGESPNSAQVSATPNSYVPANLVARLTCDDGTANDSSSYGNHGTLANGASIVTDPDRGNVLLLDGVNDYVDLGTGASLDLSDNGQATIAAWVRLGASQNQNSVVTKGEWRDAYSLLVKGDSTPKDKLWTGNDISVLSGDSVPLGSWTHVAVTINGDLTTFYINGQISGAANQDRGNPIDNNPLDHTEIGREDRSDDGSLGRWCFNGRMDDVRIYQAALTQTEIQTAMSNVVNAPVFVTEPLLKPATAAGQPYAASLAADATDADAGDTLTFLKLSGPAWLNVASNGGLSGTPLSGDVGTNSFGVRVTDSQGFFDQTTLQISVTPAPPIFSTILRQGSDVWLTWTGGIPPYQVQFQTNLQDVLWQNLGTTIPSNSMTIIPSNPAGFYRIKGQ